MSDIIISILIPAAVSFVVSILIFEHKVRFKELHIERAKVIRELWSRINDTYEKLIEDKQEDNLKKIEGKRHLPIDSWTEIREMKTYFNKNSIYFNDEIAKEFNKVFYKFQGNSTRVDITDLRNNLEALKKPLEKEFRKLLGV
ncbi:MAG TPA: hypothetical protein VI981_02910 [Candidatus Paceibacterota bacterium]